MKGAKPLNIRQIAFLAGVSVATVSRCINQPEKVMPKTRQKIEDIMKKNKYVPNPAAKSLSTGHTKTVMCVVPTLCNEFFNQVVEGCQKILGQFHYKLLVYSTNGSSDIWEQIDQRSVDGMIISGSGLFRQEKLKFDKIKVPFVLIENMEHMEYEEQEVSYVYSDDCCGVKLVLEHLYYRGNRTFGILSTADDYPVTHRRLKEVERFFQGHKDCVYHLERADYADLEASYKACEKLMDQSQKPTAIFAFNDMMAIAALRNLFHKNIKVPEEVEVFGFDGSPIGNFVTPSLSTVLAPNRRLGESAAALLVDKLAGSTENKRILFPVEMKLRETTKCCDFLYNK